MKTIGINAFHGDAAASVLKDGDLVAGVEEERFKRVKHWAGFPELAIPLAERNRGRFGGWAYPRRGFAEASGLSLSKSGSGPIAPPEPGAGAFASEKSHTGKSDGTFRLDLRYFRHLSEGVDMTWNDSEPTLGPVYSHALEELLGPARNPKNEIDQRHKDLAASLQRVYEERFFALVRALLKRTGIKQLVLAGGCAMNSVANGKLFEQSDVQDVFIQSAAGDAGTALGAALYVQHAVLGEPRKLVMEHAYWGPQFDETEIRKAVSEGIPQSNETVGR